MLEYGFTECVWVFIFLVTYLTDVNQNEFVKSLTTNLRNLRKIAENRLKFYGYHEVDQDYSDDEDDDYMARRTKKRKAAYLSL